jgi:hypothetical protein
VGLDVSENRKISSLEKRAENAGYLDGEAMFKTI